MLTLSPVTSFITINHLLFCALALAALIGWWVARRAGDNLLGTLLSLLVLGTLTVRITFIIRYWDNYRDHPWQIIDVRDGGFIAWPGVSALVLGVVYCGWRRPRLRRPLAAGLLSGLIFWSLSTLSLNIYQRGMHLPGILLTNSAGETVFLADYEGGPLVINIWATWCPPCRREMPVLENAQHHRKDVTFLFVNQAEGLHSVNRFLKHQNLNLSNVLLDGDGKLDKIMGSLALPTTLFYSDEGRLLGSHPGELSKDSLTRALEIFNTPINDQTLASPPAAPARIP
ncbi:TlpA family protein disulfide reductase [Pseudomonas koreensis]|uniref:TlpA family protein disulfide reductase n=1 Tax=Pseudomonas koreensis TaxID=198620 RepID=UPI003F86EEBC